MLRSKPKGSHKADYSSFNQDKLNIGTWNGRTMYEAAKTVQVAAEMRRFNLALRSRNVVNKQDHAEKAKHKHNQTGPDMEPPRQEKEGEANKHLAA